jgi:hypothetical protein
MPLDFNRNILSETPTSVAINNLFEATVKSQSTRGYLGASVAGSECLRQIQYSWMVDPLFPARTLDIFDRGHFFEAQTINHFRSAGFTFAPVTSLAFTALDGMFRGHADGIITDGPEVPGLKYPCLFEHKAINAKGWRKLERDGLLMAYPEYAAQVSLYQAYLEVTDNPALFTALNADTCERLHLLVPFDPVRAQEWSDRVVTVIKATLAGDLLPRFTNRADDWRCNLCRHRDRCWSQP